MSLAEPTVTDPSGELRIAWQYRRYLDSEKPFDRLVSKKSSSRLVSKQSCHDFDISKSMDSTCLANCLHTIYEPVAGETWETDVVERISSVLQSLSEGMALRAVVEDECRVHLETGVQLLRSAYQIKAAIRSRPCVVMLCIHTNWHSDKTLMHLKHLCDAVLCLSSVSDSSDLAQMATDPATLVSLLKIEKLPSLGTMRPDNKKDDLFAVRSGRKKWMIRPIEIDPAKEELSGQSNNLACHSAESF